MMSKRMSVYFFLMVVLLFLVGGCDFLNLPPNKPNNPLPASGALNVSLTPILSWNCSDPNSDYLEYELFLGEVDQNWLIEKEKCSDGTFKVNIPLKSNTSYRWKVKAIDKNQKVSESDTWTFTTEAKGMTLNLQIPDQNVNQGTLSLNLLNYVTPSTDEDIIFTLSGESVGQIQGTMYMCTLSTYGTYDVTVRLTKGNDYVEDDFKINYQPSNTADLFFNIPDQQVKENETLNLNLSQFVTNAKGNLAFSKLTGVGQIDGGSTYSYLPDYTAAGTYQVTIRVTDEVISVEDTFNLTVENTNRAPSISIPDQTKTIGEVVTIALSQYSEDLDGDTLSYSVTSGQGSVNGNIYSYPTNTVGLFQVLINVSDGIDTVSDTFNINVNDDDSLTFAIPAQYINVGETLNLTLSNYVSNPNGNMLTFSKISGVGTITGGVYSYTPNNSSIGDNNVTIRVSDGQDYVDASFVITVISTPVPPSLANIPQQIIPEGQTLTLNLNAYASDQNGDVLTFRIISGVGSISGNVYTYIPNYTESGVHSVTIEVCDGQLSTQGTFTIDVQDVNRVPIMTNTISTQSVNENATLTLNLAGYVSDADNDPLTFTKTSGVGSFTGSMYTYTPSYTESGTYSVSVEISDGKAKIQTSFGVTVNNVDREPVISNIGSQYVNEGSTLTVNLGTYVSDPDGDILTFVKTSGVGEISGNQYLYSPGYTAAGTYTIQFSVSSCNKTKTGSFSVVVNNVDRGPTISIPSQEVNAGETLTLDLRNFANDPDGDAIAFRKISGVGSVSGYYYSYTPSVNSSGDCSVTIEVSAGSKTDSHSFNISILSCNVTLDVSIYQAWRNINWEDLSIKVFKKTGTNTYEYFNFYTPDRLHSTLWPTYFSQFVFSVPYGEYAVELFYDSQEPISSGDTMEYWGRLNFVADSSSFKTEFYKQTPSIGNFYPTSGTTISLTDAPTTWVEERNCLYEKIFIQVILADPANHSNAFYLDSDEYYSPKCNSYYHLTNFNQFQGNYYGGTIADFKINIFIRIKTLADTESRGYAVDKLPWQPIYVDLN